jgi:hypothetical protein
VAGCHPENRFFLTQHLKEEATMDRRKTVHISPARHESVVVTCFQEGRISVRDFIDEALAYYLGLTPSTRKAFRRKLRGDAG